MTARCAVLGSPIAHSLSPVMHRAAYRELGLEEWEYTAVDIHAGELGMFVSGLDASWRGLSVTAPLKPEAAGLGAVADAYVARTGVANTLVLSDDIAAYNTDVPGAVAALREHDVLGVDTAAIVGAGATARSVAEALLELGAGRLVVHARRLEAARELCASLAGRGAEVSAALLGDPVGPVDLLLSTVPDAAVGDAVEPLLAETVAVFDVVYDPWPTSLAAAAVAAGLPVISGLDLLVHQAVLQVELMTGSAVSAAVLREAALAALAARA